MTVTNPSYSVNIGNTVTLDCTVTANPTENNVYWQKIVNGVTSTINSGTNTNKYGGSTVQSPSLQIFNTDQSDEATYVCFATNSIGTGQSQQTTLNVIGSMSNMLPQSHVHLKTCLLQNFFNFLILRIFPFFYFVIQVQIDVRYFGSFLSVV